MEKEIVQLFNNLNDSNREIQYDAFERLIENMKAPVDWTYAVWEPLVNSLAHSESYIRARSAQLLCALAAKSDPEERVLEDFMKIWAVTYDEETVTARHSLQSIWKIALAGQVQKDLIVAHLAKRFHTCIEEEHPTLIRYDIIVSLKKIVEATEDHHVLEIAQNLIDEEPDEKYKKKYVIAMR